MTDNDNDTSLVDMLRWEANASTRERAPHGSEKRPYKAVEIPSSGFSETLRLHYSNGRMEVIRYPYIRVIRYSPDLHELAFEYSLGFVGITGRNLNALLDLLEAQRVKRLIPLDPAVHTAPKDSSAILIEEIYFSPHNG